VTTIESTPEAGQEKQLLTLNELMELTGWGRTYVYQGARDDTLPMPVLKAGGRYYVSRKAFERWLDGEPRETA
jgi:predicted DNA-binding transcriptional regulator AlpA